MKIYTKTGDAGETGLWGGGRIGKDSLRIRTYGGIDELNAALAMALSEEVVEPLKGELLRIQGELFQLGAELATPPGKKSGAVLISNIQVEALEKQIDEMEEEMPALRSFILPGGTRISSVLHFSRTVIRRTERDLIALHHIEPLRPEVLKYVNRLSDYLFVAARYANHRAGCADVPWTPPTGTH